MTNRVFLFFSLFLYCSVSFAQKDSLDLSKAVRSLPVVQDGDYYREDQIYFNVYSGNVLTQEGLVRKDGFSYGFSIGGYRDIPLNKRGSLALAIGLGYEFNSVQLNFTGSSPSYNEIDPSELIQGITIKQSSVQFPIEFRWRNSTATKFKFWRIYSGFTFSRKFTNTLNLTTNLNSYNQKNINVLNLWNIGPHINVGHSFWNFYTYYGLSEYFNQKGDFSNFNGIHSFKIGFQIYIF